MDIPNVGRFALVQDPQGATFALYKGALTKARQSAAPVHEKNRERIERCADLRARKPKTQGNAG
jgi:hypothetical protein